MFNKRDEDKKKKKDELHNLKLTKELLNKNILE